MLYATQIQSLALTPLATTNSFLLSNNYIADLLFSIYTRHHRSNNWRFDLSIITNFTYLFTDEGHHLMDGLLAAYNALLIPKSSKVHPDAIN